MKEGYIGGSRGGVPEKIFQEKLSVGQTKGASDTDMIHYLIRPEVCTIGVVGEYNTRFQARNMGGRLFACIYSKDANGNRHPDIYAGELYKKSVEYFKEHGVPITEIAGSWSGRSDNFKEFVANMHAVSADHEVTKAEEEEAAKQTWTGRMATSLGYTEVSIENDWRKEERLTANFTFPKEKS